MPGVFSTDLANSATTYATTGQEWGVSPAGYSSLALPGITVEAGMTTAAALHSLTASFAGVDLSASGSNGKAMFVWSYVSSGTILSPKAAGGLQVRLENGANWKKWEIIGDDTDIFGGFQLSVLSPRIAGDTSSGTVNNASIDGIQIDFDMDTAGSDVCPSAGWGTARQGSGHTFTGGTVPAPVTFVDVTAFDLASSYGVYYDRFNTVICNGKLRSGDGVTDAIFHHTGGSGYMPGQPVEDGFVEWIANGVTESIFQTGDYSGGEVSNGFNLGAAPGQRLTLSCANAAGKHKHYGLSAPLAPSTLNAGSEMRSCVHSNVDSFTPNGAVIEGCSYGAGSANTPAIIINSPAELAALTGGKLEGRDYGIEITAAGTYTLDGTQFAGVTSHIVNSSTGLVTVNNTNGSNASTFVNTNGGTTDIPAGAPITIEVTVVDKVTQLPINGAHVYLSKTGDPLTVYLNGATDVNGNISTTLAFDVETAVIGWARDFDFVGGDYVAGDIVGQYTASGFSATIQLEPI